MNCKFLALSATVGNAEQLRGWMERVRGDQLLGVETVDAELRNNFEINPEVFFSSSVDIKQESPTEITNGQIVLRVVQTLNGKCNNISLTDFALPNSNTVIEINSITIFHLKQKIYELDPSTDPHPVEHARYPMQLIFNGVLFILIELCIIMIYFFIRWI
jgi:hypothetical protein